MLKRACFLNKLKLNNICEDKHKRKFGTITDIPEIYDSFILRIEYTYILISIGTITNLTKINSMNKKLTAA